ncbi:Oleate hydratase [bioreactor metagenome]|uniref:Oleate hydratase n=1 Tax=bioreactor metagenome TaxID=1076179 RepID=A0A645CGT0_9ZZZZ
MSYTLNRQPHFKSQPKDQLVVWVYGLFVDVPGNYIKKPMRECTGVEITEEWLYHLGVPEAEIHELATKSAHCIPCMMPYITAFFMPRAKGDRPKVVPEGSVNFAFIGQFADTVRDTVFTTEYSVRTAMEAVYTLLEVDRGVPEVFGSCYDIRVLLDSTSKMLDGKKLTDLHLPIPPSLLDGRVMQMASKTVIPELLKRYNLI